MTEYQTEQEKDVCNTCGGTGVVVINAGYCGGCERCGSIEEQEKPCPDCTHYQDNESNHAQVR